MPETGSPWWTERSNRGLNCGGQIKSNMSVTRKFRFGVIPPLCATAQQWSNLTLKIEDLGYSTLLLADHFDDRFGPIAGLMSAALATSRLRVGTLVFDNDYRHPAVLAKELATLDLLTGGRLEFGLGAGWMAVDYNKSGIPYDPIGTRIDRLEEAIAIFKGLFGDDLFSFTGKHYKIERMRGVPKPVQKPHPPLTIGGGGKRILTIAGREADIVSVNFVLRSGVYTTGADPTGSARATAEKIRWIQEAAGERMNAIELSVTGYFVAV